MVAENKCHLIKVFEGVEM